MIRFQCPSRALPLPPKRHIRGPNARAEAGAETTRVLGFCSRAPDVLMPRPESEG